MLRCRADYELRSLTPSINDVLLLKITESFSNNEKIYTKIEIVTVCNLEFRFCNEHAVQGIIS